MERERSSWRIHSIFQNKCIAAIKETLIMHYFSLKNERVHNHLLGEITKQVQSICSLQERPEIKQKG